MSEQKEPSKKMRIHFLIQDAEGAIKSNEGGDNPALRVGTNSRWRCACDRAIVMGPHDRGTDAPWAVRCDACKASGEFKAANRPKPGLAQESGDLEADGTTGAEAPPAQPAPVKPKTRGVEVKEGGCC